MSDVKVRVYNKNQDGTNDVEFIRGDRVIRTMPSSINTNIINTTRGYDISSIEGMLNYIREDKSVMLDSDLYYQLKRWE